MRRSASGREIAGMGVGMGVIVDVDVRARHRPSRSRLAAEAWALSAVSSSRTDSAPTHCSAGAGCRVLHCRAAFGAAAQRDPAEGVLAGCRRGRLVCKTCVSRAAHFASQYNHRAWTWARAEGGRSLLPMMHGSFPLPCLPTWRRCQPRPRPPPTPAQSKQASSQASQLASSLVCPDPNCACAYLR